MRGKTCARSLPRNQAQASAISLNAQCTCQVSRTIAMILQSINTSLNVRMNLQCNCLPRKPQVRPSSIRIRPSNLTRRRYSRLFRHSIVLPTTSWTKAAHRLLFITKVKSRPRMAQEASTSSKGFHPRTTQTSTSTPSWSRTTVPLRQDLK